MEINKNIAFYTCLFGVYDFISEPNKDLKKKFNFYIITNQNHKSFNNLKKIYIKKTISSFCKFMEFDPLRGPNRPFTRAQ